MTSQCIPWPWVCDGDEECPNGNDESKDLCQGSGKCGGNFTSLHGVITSPSYPDVFPNNQDCIYTISTPSDTYVMLTFRVIDINNDQWNCNDYLQIRDGGSMESLLLTSDESYFIKGNGELCGNDLPYPIQSTKNQMTLR